MRYLKMLALAAMACTALMAFASSALATTLTEGNGVIVKTGTVVDASLKAKTSALLSDTTGLIQNTCTVSTVKGKTTNETGTTVTGSIESLTFETCTRPTKTLALGQLHVEWIKGTNNGTVFGSGSEVETEVPGGGHCVYGTGASTHLGTLTAATTATGTATLDVNTVLNLIKTVNGTCTSTAKWTAEYVVTTPLGLKVDE